MDQDLFVRVFNEAGPAYREAGAPFLDHFAALLVERANLRPADHVVDLATGPGTVVAPISHAVGRDGAAIGVDLAERQLALARTALQDAACHPRFVHGDASALDLADRSAAAVTCGFGLPYFHDPLRALREAARVARPGGAVVATTWSDPFFAPAGTRLLDTLERFEVPYLHRRLTSEPAQLAQWCFRADLRDVTIEQHDHEIVFPSFDAWWAMNQAFAFLTRLDAAAPQTRQAVRDQLAEDSTVVRPDGSVLCTMRVSLLRATA